MGMRSMVPGRMAERLNVSPPAGHR